MMDDDETIIIRVNAAQGEAALKALGAAGIQAGKDVATIETATAGSTDKLAAFGAKLFGLTKIAATFGEVIRQVGSSIEFESSAAKEATTATADLFTAIGSLDAAGAGAALGRIIGNIEAMREGLDETTLAWGRMTNAADAAKFAGILKAQQDLVKVHQESVAALNLRATALAREVESQQENGNVSEFLKGQLKEVLDAYVKMDEFAPSALQRQASGLGVVSTESERATEKVNELAKAHAEALDKAVGAIGGESKARQESTALLLEAIKVVESHGTVTVESQAKIQEAIGKELALYTQYGDQVPAALQATADAYRVVATEQQKVIDNAAKIIADIDAAAIKANQAQASQGNAGVAENAANAEQLKKQISEIEDSPIITAEQQSNLDRLKNALLDNTRAAKDLNSAFTVTAENYLTEEEALAKLNAEMAIAEEQQRKLTQYHNQAADSTEYNDKAAAGLYETYVELNDILGDTGGTFNDLGASTDDVARGFKAIGDEGEKGTKKASEGLGKMKEGLEEAIPLANELKGILQEIVTLGAQADI